MKSTGRGTSRMRMQSLVTDPYCGFWEVVWETAGPALHDVSEVSEEVKSKSALQHARSGFLGVPGGAAPVF